MKTSCRWSEAKEGVSPVLEINAKFESRAFYVGECLNIAGPSAKPKLLLMIDSELVL